MHPFPTLADALRQAARDVLKEGSLVAGVSDPLSVGSSFGNADRPFWEVQGYQFTLDDPTAVLVESNDRPISVPYLLANILWTLAVDDRVAGIEFWNDRAATFSDNGELIRSAAGPRLFGAPQQFASIVDRLKLDGTTRRGLIMLIDQGDLAAPTRDVPCTIGLQLLLRSGALNAIGIMRSQSALMVMPYDVALLTTIQRLVASALDVPLGTYTHFAASFHVYDEEVALTRRVAENGLIGHYLPAPRSVDQLQPLLDFKSALEVARPEDLIQLCEKMTSSSVSPDGSFEDVTRSVLLGYALAKFGYRDEAGIVWSRGGQPGRLAALRTIRS